MARVRGIGGVFFKSADPERLAGWYRRWLGIELQSAFAANLQPADMPPGAFTVWGVFRDDTDYFSPGQDFMINLVVDDLEGALAQVRDGGARVEAEVQEHEYGRFGWFIDPDGNKVELWQPRGAGPGAA